jgi:hypothetical protein
MAVFDALVHGPIITIGSWSGDRFFTVVTSLSMPPSITLRQALADPHLFGPHFNDPSWDGWKVFFDALFAEKVLDDAALQLYRQCTGRTGWPSSPYTEAELVVGRRGGKSRALALVATYLACFRDYTPYLAAGEVCTIAVLASDRSQARAIFRFIDGLLEDIPLLKTRVVAKDSETIVLRGRVRIEITTASFRSTRGYTYGAVLADEVAFWHSDESSLNPDTEILRALRPGLTTIPGAMLLIASSPYARRGELFNLWRRHYGHDDARVLVWQAPTEVMNPSVDKAVIVEANDDDPAAARAEYGAQFRDDLIDYVSAETIAALTMVGRTELPPMAGVSYSAFVDPSGGRNDSMTLAIGHLSANGICVLDALFEARPPFDPEAVVAQFAAELRRYGIASLVGDKFGGEWVVQSFARHGILLGQSARPKSDLYHDLLPLINAGRIELLDHPRLARELTSLERRTARSGRDSIDHMPGAHDDHANAVAGLLVELDLDRRPLLVKISDVAGDAEAPDPPVFGFMYLVITDAGPDIATVFCGTDPHGPLYIVDAETVFYRSGLFGELMGQLWEMAVGHHCAIASIYAPPHLVAQIGRGVELPEDFDPDLLLTRAAGHAGGGGVRFCSAVKAKMSTKPIGAALTLKAGDEIEGALQKAFIAAIQIKYGDLSLH